MPQYTGPLISRQMGDCSARPRFFEAVTPAGACRAGRFRCSLWRMTNEERKPIVAQLLKEGSSLSEIQDYLRKEKGDSITYMELRLLLSEMPDAKLPEKEISKTPPAMPDVKLAENAEGKLSIGVDQVPAPGSMLSGYARFNSGAKAHSGNFPRSKQRGRCSAIYAGGRGCYVLERRQRPGTGFFLALGLAQALPASPLPTEHRLAGI